MATFTAREPFDLGRGAGAGIFITRFGTTGVGLDTGDCAGCLTADGNS